MSNRPSRRTLVRWNDDHDKELLMWIVYCSAEQGLKLPWARIAQCMGPSFTEGACTQHLAKIRNRMEEEGLHVPPPQKRGTTTRTGSSIYRPKKSKDAEILIPRVRPDVAPPTHDDDLFDVEEEEVDEEIEEDVGVGRTARKTVSQKSSATVKEDSSEDEAMPALYDSDNEYGAKKPRADLAKKNQDRTSNKNLQMKLNFGLQSAGQGNADTLSSIHDSPGLKFESIEDDTFDSFAPPSPTKQQGTRRKSSVMTIDDADEYDPGGASRGRAKKAKGGRNTKKPKINDKAKANSKKKTGVGYDADRIAMPPPPLPYTNSNNAAGIDWNTNFMQQPFPAPDIPRFSNTEHNRAYGHHSPTSNSFDSFGFDAIPGSFNPTFNAYQRPGLNYLPGGLVSTTSAPNTRNHSFASIASTSSAEISPKSWSQPMRSPMFPNPREATNVLHQTLNAQEAGVHQFGLPYQRSDMSVPWANESYTTPPDQETTTDGAAALPSSADLFGEAPHELMTDDFLASLMPDQTFD